MSKLSESELKGTSATVAKVILHDLYTVAYAIAVVFAIASVSVLATGFVRDEQVLRSLGAAASFAFALSSMLIDRAKARLFPEDEEN